MEPAADALSLTAFWTLEAGGGFRVLRFRVLGFRVLGFRVLGFRGSLLQNLYKTLISPFGSQNKTPPTSLVVKLETPNSLAPNLHPKPYPDLLLLLKLGVLDPGLFSVALDNDKTRRRS